MRNREEAARVAQATITNKPGMCQAQVRAWFGAASVGDFDGDGAADAEDGWKSEPRDRRHSDRNPPRGVPVSFLGGARDNGHRAISLGNGRIRSTDFDSTTRRYRSGVVGTGTLDEVAKAMGVTYAGWSETIDGEMIPLPTRGRRVDDALARLQRAEKRAKDGSARDVLIKRAIRLLKRVPYLKGRSQ